MTFLDDFLVRAVLAGLILVLAMAPLGCFVVWRRLAYFGDSTAHAAILGVVLALATGIPAIWAVLAIAMAVAMLLASISERNMTSDTLLGVVAHGGLAFGLVFMSIVATRTVELEKLLFGDILSVSKADLGMICIGALLVIALLVWRWQAQLLVTINPDMAAAMGLNVKREKLIVTIALSVVVAVGMQVVGALLIAALLVIPPAAARPLAKGPEQMVVLTAIVGVLSVLIGTWASFNWDTPTGPTIICVAVIAVVFGQLLGRRLG